MPRRPVTSPYCVACRLRVRACVCAEAPRLAVATRVVMVIHSREWGRATNTGQLARLGLREVEIRLHGRLTGPLRSGLVKVPSSPLVLFPGRGARPLGETLAERPGPVTLLVPDGTWHQAENIMRRSPLLQGARPVRLEGPSLGLPWLRHNARPERCSTFEALARALGILEGPEAEARLLGFFRLVLDRRRVGPIPRSSLHC